jgi:hypothetical protein
MRQSWRMASPRKPVIVRKFSRDWIGGYASQAFDQLAPGMIMAPHLEILDQGGRLLRLEWEQVKWVCYVRDLPAAVTGDTDPERLLHKRFSSRPRAAGVWMRMTLGDGDHLEGLAANDRSLIDGPGLMLTPPDTRSNTQRVYVPRSAIESLELVGLIGAGLRRGTARAPQPELFPADAQEG